MDLSSDIPDSCKNLQLSSDLEAVADVKKEDGLPPSNPPNTSSGGGPEVGQGRYTNLLKYIRNTVLNGLYKMKESESFRKPVDAEALKIPFYNLFVKRPMDIGTVRKRIDSKYYRNGGECLKDLGQVFANAYAYNKPGSILYEFARGCEEFLINKLNEFSEEEVEVVELARKPVSSEVDLVSWEDFSYDKPIRDRVPAKRISWLDNDAVPRLKCEIPASSSSKGKTTKYSERRSSMDAAIPSTSHQSRKRYISIAQYQPKKKEKTMDVYNEQLYGDKDRTKRMTYSRLKKMKKLIMDIPLEEFESFIEEMQDCATIADRNIINVINSIPTADEQWGLYDIAQEIIAKNRRQKREERREKRRRNTMSIVLPLPPAPLEIKTEIVESVPDEETKIYKIEEMDSSANFIHSLDSTSASTAKDMQVANENENTMLKGTQDDDKSDFLSESDSDAVLDEY